MKFKIVLRDLRLNLKRRDACRHVLSNATPTLCCVKKRAEILSVNFKLKYESCVFFIAYRAYSFKRAAFGDALKFDANLAGFSRILNFKI